MREILLVRYGEVFLKGQNRPFFLKKLVGHVKDATREVGGKVWLSDGRIYVSDFTDIDEAMRRVSRVFGVHSVSRAIEMEKDDFEAICAQAAKMMEPLSGIPGYIPLEGSSLVMGVYLVELCAVVALMTSVIGRGDGSSGILWRFCCMCPVSLLVFSVCAGILP